MKKILLFLFVLLMAVPAFGIIAELESSTADRNLTSIVTVLTDTPDASNDMLCQAYIVLGSAGRPLDGTGGAFEFVMTIGGQTVQPSPQIAVFGTEVRASIWTSQFLVPTGEEVIIRAKSPNGADTDVSVTAYLYDVFPVNVASGKVTLADGVTHGGSTAVLELKSVDVTNPDGNAIIFHSTGGDGNGFRIIGNGQGHGVYITSGNGGLGMFVESLADVGMLIKGREGSYGLQLQGPAGDISASEIDAILADTTAMSAVDTDATSATHAAAYVTLEAGKASDDAYNGMSVSVTDATDGNIETRRIEDWTSGRKITFDRELSFTPVQNDLVRIYAMPYNITAAIAGGSANTYIVTDTGAVGGTPIPDVNVWVTADSAGVRLVVSGVTDSNGAVIFYLDAGTTYYVWMAKSGYSFSDNGESWLAE